MADKVIRIGLLWHSANSGNLGVGALTIANMNIARQVAVDMGLSPKFVIIGMRDSGPPYVAPADAEVLVVDTRSLLNPRGCWSQFGSVDCVLDIGAGDSFAEIYGLKRFMFLWLTKVMAIARGKPLLLSPQTIGPFTRTPYRQLARYALVKAETVVARDQASLEALRSLAPRANGVLAVDVAFALPFDDNGHRRGGPKVRVGVNVSGLLFNEAVSGRNRFGLGVDYAKLTRRFIGELLTRPDVEVHLVTHAIDVGGSADDDAATADLIACEFPGVIRVPTFATPSEAKSYISSLDFLVAGRMHACIAAFSAGTPVVPVAYSRKFSGLFGMLGYDWMVPVKGGALEEAHLFLMDCLARRVELETAARAGMLKVDALLDAYRMELRRLFAGKLG